MVLPLDFIPTAHCHVKALAYLVKANTYQLSRLLQSSCHMADTHSTIISRDENDWPIVATALLLKSPVWTEITTTLVVESRFGQVKPSNYICAVLKANEDSGSAGALRHSYVEMRSQTSDTFGRSFLMTL